MVKDITKMRVDTAQMIVIVFVTVIEIVIVVDADHAVENSKSLNKKVNNEEILQNRKSSKFQHPKKEKAVLKKKKAS